MESLLSRLKRRKMVQWALAYLAAAWLLSQVAHLLAQSFEWPLLVPRFVIAAAAVGLPICLVVAWYHGERGRQRVTGPELLILAGLFVVGGGLLTFVVGGVSGGPAGTAGDGAPLPSPGAGSIAVLPFVNMSPDPGDEFFSDGIAEEIRNALTTVAGLSVAARASVLAFKGSELDVLEIGRRLNVAHVLEGSVRRAGEDLRISAQLIDARTGFHLWSRTFDRRLENTLQIQEEISRTIVDRLQLDLSAAEDAGLTPQEPRSFQVYELYLLGHQLVDSGGEAELRRAVQILREAHGLDPEFAPTLVALAHAYMRLGVFFAPPEDVFPLAREAAERALELDPSRAGPHIALAFYHTEYDWNWEEAEARFRRGLSLDPGEAMAQGWYQNLLRILNRCDEAVERGSAAVRLDPLSAIALQDLGLTLYYCRRFDEAADASRRAIRQDPNLAAAHMRLAMASEELGRHDDALSHARRAVELTDRRSTMLAVLGRVSVRAGLVGEAQAILDELSTRLAAGEYVDGVYLSGIHSALGELDSAVAWLERAYEERSASMVSLAVHPWHDPLRGREDFRELLSRMGL